MTKAPARKRRRKQSLADFQMVARLGLGHVPSVLTSSQLEMAERLVHLEKNDPTSFWFWIHRLSDGQSMPGQRISRRAALARLEARRRLAKRDRIRRKSFVEGYQNDNGYSWDEDTIRDYLRRDIPQLLKCDELFEYEVELVMVELRPELEQELMAKYDRDLGDEYY